MWTALVGEGTISRISNPNDNAMRFDGILKSWDDERGFGFIEPALGGQEIFVHIKAFPRGSTRPQVGQRLSFEVEPGLQGKKRARDVQPIRPTRRPPLSDRQVRARRGTATLFVLPAFLVVYLAVDILWRPPRWIGLVYVCGSLITFVAYAADKSAAARRAWRTQESALHVLALAGGWPGALVAQQVLRHKSAKAEFRRVFWATVLFNVVLFIIICSPAGQAYWVK